MSKHKIQFSICSKIVDNYDELSQAEDDSTSETSNLIECKRLQSKGDTLSIDSAIKIDKKKIDKIDLHLNIKSAKKGDNPTSNKINSKKEKTIQLDKKASLLSKTKHQKFNSLFNLNQKTMKKKFVNLPITIDREYDNFLSLQSYQSQKKIVDLKAQNKTSTKFIKKSNNFEHFNLYKNNQKILSINKNRLFYTLSGSISNANLKDINFDSKIKNYSKSPVEKFRKSTSHISLLNKLCEDEIHTGKGHYLQKHSAKWNTIISKTQRITDKMDDNFCNQKDRRIQ